MNVVADDKLSHVVPDKRSAEFYLLAFASDAGGDKRGKRGIAVLHGLTGREAEPVLERAVKNLTAHAGRLADTRRFASAEYTSPYAALDALAALHKTARLFPDAVWTIEEPGS